MRAGSLLLLAGALLITAVASLVGVLSLLVWGAVLWGWLRYGEILQGKDIIYVPLLPLLAFLLYKWSRESWLKWNGSRTAGVSFRKAYFLGAFIVSLALLTLWLWKPYEKVPRGALETVLKTNLKTTRSVLVDYKNDRGEYPRSLQDLVDKGYLRKVPIDPMTRRDDSWVLTRDGQGRVVDVRSGSDGRALDGSLYGRW